MSEIDLHMHSGYSIDGEFTPKELIEKAQQAGLKIVALSDHNTQKGVREMIAEGQKKNIRVIKAMEFDTVFHGIETHILGYNIDIDHPYFQDLEDRINSIIKSTYRDTLVTIRDYFHAHVDIEGILGQIKDGDNPFPILYGTVINDPLNQDIEAFKPYQPGGSRSEPAVVNFYWDLLGPGSEPYKPQAFPSSQETIDIIHQAHGVAVLAHPWKNYYQREDYLQELVDSGLDGIEAYSNYHEPYHNQYYHNYCKEHNLPMSCGSDFHGKMKKKIKMGEYGCNEDALKLCQPLLALIDK